MYSQVSRWFASYKVSQDELLCVCKSGFDFYRPCDPGLSLSPTHSVVLLIPIFVSLYSPLCSIIYVDTYTSLLAQLSQNIQPEVEHLVKK